jgi:RNA recognition motif-containing protein
MGRRTLAGTAALLFSGLAGESERRMQSKLYVGNLAQATTEDDLRQLFAQAGGVTSVEVIKDRDTGQSKGFAFVTMATPADAQKAIGMLNNFAIRDRALQVNLAKPREERGAPQSRMGAFGNGGGRARGHKRRGGNRRY